MGPHEIGRCIRALRPYHSGLDRRRRLRISLPVGPGGLGHKQAGLRPCLFPSRADTQTCTVPAPTVPDQIRGAACRRYHCGRTHWPRCLATRGVH
ncbi:hypothetical protein chiPu_0017493 [Chiloscyllium punctatum]|uniref:Uncharacterized protein n=1 Tax=Chiloscyllium punctatum TaxID=137246 RepID=A0A401RGF3_CHIPU|nr:hypothetical protein [Chiloscyllium punctatum]